MHTYELAMNSVAAAKKVWHRCQPNFARCASRKSDGGMAEGSSHDIHIHYAVQYVNRLTMILSNIAYKHAVTMTGRPMDVMCLVVPKCLSIIHFGTSAEATGHFRCVDMS